MVDPGVAGDLGEQLVHVHKEQAELHAAHGEFAEAYAVAPQGDKLVTVWPPEKATAKPVLKNFNTP